MDLRERVVAAHAETGWSADVAARFAVRQSWVGWMPPHSPDLNPIKPLDVAQGKATLMFKAYLRRLARRTVPDLIAEIAEVVGRVTARDARRFDRSCEPAARRRKPL